MRRALLLSVRTEFAEQIFQGEKTVELRRRRPCVTRGDYLIIYVPTPHRCIAGVVVVERVIEARPFALWRRVRQSCGISFAVFASYFQGVDVGYGIVLKRPARLSAPVPLDVLRAIQPGFSPQGYRYLTREHLSDAIAQIRPHLSAI